jgi:ATP-dependent Zn protease
LAVGFGMMITLSLLSEPESDDTAELAYGAFRARVAADQVASVEIHQDSGTIEGRLVDDSREFTAQGPSGGLPEPDIRLLDAHDVDRNYAADESNPIDGILLYLLPFALIVGVLVWTSRRAHSSDLEDALAVRMGGSAAEELVLGVASTGAHDDLVAATARRDVVVSDEHDMTLTLADRVPERLHAAVIAAPEG